MIVVDRPLDLKATFERFFFHRPQVSFVRALSTFFSCRSVPVLAEVVTFEQDDLGCFCRKTAHPIHLASQPTVFDRLVQIMWKRLAFNNKRQHVFDAIFVTEHPRIVAHWQTTDLYGDVCSCLFTPFLQPLEKVILASPFLVIRQQNDLSTSILSHH